MRERLFRDDVLFLQRFLACAGLYAGTLDGLAGPVTDSGEAAFASRCDAVAAAEGRFDARSEKNIRGLRIEAQVLARRSLTALRAAGHDARIISGTRSYAEQDALYAKGRGGIAGPRVTNARGGQSWHNFGLAWDIGLFSAGRYLSDAAAYRAVAPIGRVAGTEWGGDWTSFPDAPHYQVASRGETIAAARARFEMGGR